MRALFALAAGATLPVAGGVALVVSWIYAVDRAEPFPGLAFLAAGIVALGWSAWLRRRRGDPPSATGDDTA